VPAPSVLPNHSRVIRCIQWLLQRITHDNGFYTNGVVVDLDGDPRLMVQDRDGSPTDRLAAFEQYKAGFSLQLGDAVMTQATGAAVGAAMRWEQQVKIHAYQQISIAQEAAGLTLSDIHGMLRRDAEWVLMKDHRVKEAHAALYARDASFGAAKPYCMELRVTNWADMGEAWPYAYSLGSVLFTHEETTPSVTLT
jgi:hypothetical protein